MPDPKARQAIYALEHEIGTLKDRLTELTNRIAIRSSDGSLWVQDDEGTDAQLEADAGYIEGARVWNITPLTIATGTWTSLTFNREMYDTNDMHSLITNTDRLVANHAGIYVVTASIRWAPNAVGTRWLTIENNLLGSIAEVSAEAITTGDVQGMSVTTICKYNAGEYAIARVYQDSGGNLQISAYVRHSPDLMMQRIG